MLRLAECCGNCCYYNGNKTEMVCSKHEHWISATTVCDDFSEYLVADEE